MEGEVISERNEGRDIEFRACLEGKFRKDKRPCIKLKKWTRGGVET